MSLSVFVEVPDLDAVIGDGTKQNVKIAETKCRPGDTKRYGGDYESIMGEIRADLFRRDSPVNRETADKLLRKARDHFYNKSNVQ